MSIGRVDQYMYPFYKADKEAGRLTDYQAFDIAGCMLIKMSEMMWATSEDASKFFAGYQPFVNMTLGGVTRSGADATNDLTYLLMVRRASRQDLPAFPGLPYPQQEPREVPAQDR